MIIVTRDGQLFRCRSPAFLFLYIGYILFPRPQQLRPYSPLYSSSLLDCVLYVQPPNSRRGYFFLSPDEAADLLVQAAWVDSYYQVHYLVSCDNLQLEDSSLTV